MKSVLITSNAYYPNIGGIENSLRYLAKAYVELGYQVNVVVSDLNAIDEQQLAASESFEGVNIFRYSSYSDISKWLKPLRGLFASCAMFRLMRKVNREFAPEFTLSRFHSTTVMAKIAGLKNVAYLMPGVVRNQNQSANLVLVKGAAKVKQRLQLLVHDFIQQISFRVADQLFVFSDNMKQQVNACFKSPPKLNVVKPGVDTDRFAPTNEQARILQCQTLGLPVDKRILLIVGRFVRAKGISYALEAMISLTDCHLVIVGGGEEEELYHHYVQKFGLEERVTFAGIIQDPVPYYEVANLFLMTSTYEPLGQTILESLASGVPVVAFKSQAQVVTATSELLAVDEAVFVESVSSKCLTQAINEVNADKQRYKALSDVSRKIALSRFSWLALASAISKVKS